MILKKQPHDYALRRQKMAERAFVRQDKGSGEVEQILEDVKVETYLHHFHGEQETESDTLPAKAHAKISVRNLNFFYGSRQVLFENNLDIAEKKLTAIIGRVGSGKSTHIRAYNRMFELYRDQHASGGIFFDGQDIFAPSAGLLELRRRIGMLFQQPTTFPLSIYENVAYGLKLHYRIPGMELEHRIESALKKVELFDEIYGQLHHPALILSPDQQQRLCLARIIALEPEVLLLDDATITLGPLATRRFEALLASLKEDYTIVLATHNMQQAARVSDFTAFLSQGYIVEFGRTKQLFTNPVKKQTEDYITGRFE